VSAKRDDTARRFPFLALAAFVALAGVHAPRQVSAQIAITSADLGGLPARAIGPAVMSGRIAAIDAVPGDPLTIYVGAAGGGVWKSVNAGTTFEPVFDEYAQSIGAIAIDPSETETVWVGTGETWTRNSVSVGTGLYRTTDGGANWEFMGLGDSERIARIEVDPNDGQTVFVCATGHLWDANEERGVFRTTDGGETWEKVLYIDEDTGCADLAMDPHAPTILYAGMWQFRRWPWSFESGGPGSGLYRSTDGGDSWEELTEGLPEGEKGRIGVDVAPSRPNVVYAVVEADSTALYRSDDLGASWEQVSAGAQVKARPFYYAHVIVDPTDHERIYKMATSMGISSDGGKTFSGIPAGPFGGSVHSDHHALWINPDNPAEILLGTDGGVYISQDRARTWRHVGSLPLSQFYEISYDMEWPYNVYGGLQDNGTWTGPSQSRGGIQNRDWRNLFPGDGFHAFVDPGDPEYIYVESQGGNLQRYSRTLGEQREIRPYMDPAEGELRFNWNTPIHVSRTTAGTLYVGAQFLFRSRNRGDSWDRISPDLTTNDPEKQKQRESGGLTIDNSSAENHTTIYTISESPLDPTVIWAGTDDGNLQVSRDDGATWTNVAENVGVPANTWVSHVEASPHAAGTAFVTFDGHRTGDMASYVFRTDDYGETWIALATEELEGYAHVVKQDPANANLLYVGAEFGLFLSLDGGGHWARLSAEAGGLPPVSVRDLAIHPRDHDLIIGTHGRGIYILDDLTPIRHLTAEALEAQATLLPSRPAAMRPAGFLQEFPGDAGFVGPNPPEAAAIVYYQPRRHLFGDLKVEVYGQEGELLSSVAGTKRRGFNRVDWQMRLPPPRIPPASGFVNAFQGPRALAGSYTVRLIKGDSVFEGQVAIRPDPRSPHTEEDRALARETSLRLYEILEDLTYIVETVIELRDAARELAVEVDEGSRLGRRLTGYADELEAFRTDLVVSSEGGLDRSANKLRERLGNLFGAVSGYDGRPSEPQITRTRALEVEMEGVQSRFDEMVGPTLIELNEALVGAEREPLTPKTREEWEAEAGG
jgi:photosystem II stability/assembly factor-like uncharacterized protein